jgi:hypothetical protein
MPVVSHLPGWLVLIGASFFAVGLQAADGHVLHERVDALIDAAAVGPLNPPASDADFLRRASLDLAGIIPTAEEARAFLNDTSPNKREQLIDRLLASPQYARHMALVWDVALMERRADKTIKTPEWQAYLRQSFLDNKPLDQLFREIVIADGAEEDMRPAARFLLDRDCEPNLVTRDLGRVLFGMDLQCAQCHDHPLVTDYFQSDYYGLYAFVLRSSLFTDAKKKVALVSEKADGEANYKSVFTGDSADKVLPRLPKGAVLADEPTFPKGAEYVLIPAKDVRGVPKYSRRAQLAAMLKESHEFRRNMANRLWAHLFGRGIVHPVDFHHAANPPSHPDLLALLADELAISGFDIRKMLRELALTRAYQRACDTPDVDSIGLPDPAEEIARLESQRPALQSKIDELSARTEALSSERKTLQEQVAQKRAELTQLKSALVAAEETAAKAAASQKTAAELLAKKNEQSRALAEASVKAQDAVAKLPEDKVLLAAAQQIAERAGAIAKEVEAAAKSEAEFSTLAKTAVEQIAAASQALAAATAGAPTEQLTKLDREHLDLQRALADARFAIAALDGRIATAKAIDEYRQKQADPAAAEAAKEALVEQWTVACQIGPLKALSAEQFALSMMQATGVTAGPNASAKAGIEKSPPDVLKNASDTDKPRILADLVEAKAFEQLRSNINNVVNLYGTDPGADFQATVNQALFFGNGPLVGTWVSPSKEFLAARLATIEDPSALAEELYLAVLTRFPTDDERGDVAAYLKPRDGDRAVAASELVWALASSNEFRFNH